MDTIAMTDNYAPPGKGPNKTQVKEKRRPVPAKRYLVIALWLIAIAVVWISNDHGMWIITSVAGGFWGLIFKSKKSYFGALCLGALAWFLPLIWDTLLGLDISKAGTVVAELAGLGGSFLIPILITIITGALLSLAGAFLVRSIFMLSKSRISLLAQANREQTE